MKNKITSYLDHIKFDPDLKKRFVYKYLNNPRLVFLLVVTLLTLGIVSFSILPRRLNPEVKIPIVIVNTIYPGAGPQDIESLITIPLENELDGIDGLQTLTSRSQENVSVVSLEFESSVDGEEAEREVQSLVDKVDLPDNAVTPQVQLVDFEDQPIWRFALYTDANEVSLFNFARELRDSIEEVNSVNRVEIQGLEEEEIRVLVDHEKLLDYDISPLTLSNSIKDQIDSFPTGNVEVNSLTFPLSVEKGISDLEDLREIRLTTSGEQYSLGDVAEVTLHPDKDTNSAYIANEGEISKVVVFAVYKNLNSDIVSTSQEVKELVNDELFRNDIGFRVLTLEDSAEDIDAQFNDLVANFLSTIVLVFITLLLFLGVRQALIVSISIPITFLSAFIAMNFFGLSINFLTLFSLLLALGLLVDDAIVIVSAMTSYYRTGKFTASETGSLVWRDFIVPIWSTTLTTIWAFLPLLLATGIIGEFIKAIPLVVSSTLFASTSVAVLIILPVMIYLLEPSIPDRVKKFITILLAIAAGGAVISGVISTPLLIPTIIILASFYLITYRLRRHLAREFGSILSKILGKKSRINNLSRYLNGGVVDIEKLVVRYQAFIQKVIVNTKSRRRIIFMVIVFSIFSYVLLPLGLVKNEFFPRSDFDVLYINLELPQGTTIESTTRTALSLLDDLKEEEHIEYISLEPSRIVDFNNTSGISSGGNLAAFTMKLVDESERPSSLEIADRLRTKYSSYSEGDLSIVEITGGPPAGADLQIKLLGEDLSVLDLYASDLVNYLEGVGGVTNVQKSITAGSSKLTVSVDQVEAEDVGISNQNLGFWLRTYVSGFDLGSITLEEEEFDITMRLSEGDLSPSQLSKIQIPNQQGERIPFDQLAEIELAVNPTVITRENGERTISVSASVSEGFNIPELNTQLENYADNNLGLIPGYDWQTGGVNEENERSVQSILLAMGLSAILILVTMVLQLGSFRKALIVLLVIPLAVSGVFIMFGLTATPLSFPALIGVLALFGIVVNNSIVVVEKINQNLNIGMQLKDAVSDASARRLEPILFSSLTTIIGLVPITLSDPLWRGLGGAIIFGLMFSGAIMLLFIPTVFYSIYKGEYK